MGWGIPSSLMAGVSWQPACGDARALLGPSPRRHRTRAVGAPGDAQRFAPAPPRCRWWPSTRTDTRSASSNPVPPTHPASPAQVFALLAGELKFVGDPDLRRATALALRKAIREASPACKRELDALGLDAGHVPASACSVGLAIRVCPGREHHPRPRACATRGRMMLRVDTRCALCCPPYRAARHRQWNLLNGSPTAP